MSWVDAAGEALGSEPSGGGGGGGGILERIRVAGSLPAPSTLKRNNHCRYNKKEGGELEKKSCSSGQRVCVSNTHTHRPHRRLSFFFIYRCKLKLFRDKCLEGFLLFRSFNPFFV